MRDARKALEQKLISEPVLKFMQDYADGVNEYIHTNIKSKLDLPLEFLLVRYPPEGETLHWKVEDSLAVMKLIGIARTPR